MTFLLPRFIADAVIATVLKIFALLEELSALGALANEEEEGDCHEVNEEVV